MLSLEGHGDHRLAVAVLYCSLKCCRQNSKRGRLPGRQTSAMRHWGWCLLADFPSPMQDHQNGMQDDPSRDALCVEAGLQHHVTFMAFIRPKCKILRHPVRCPRTRRGRQSSLSTFAEVQPSHHRFSDACMYSVVLVVTWTSISQPRKPRSVASHETVDGATVEWQ